MLYVRVGYESKHVRMCLVVFVHVLFQKRVMCRTSMGAYVCVHVYLCVFVCMCMCVFVCVCVRARHAWAHKQMTRRIKRLCKMYPKYHPLIVAEFAEADDYKVLHSIALYLQTSYARWWRA